MKTQVRLIFARGSNGVIGRENKLPWHLPADMAHFKALTKGRTVLMGRLTWDSLPARFRPLPGRRNLVLTRQQDWSADGAERVASLQEAIVLCAGEPVLWVIGGSQLYFEALPVADCVEVTEILKPFEGDAYAPVIGPEWHEAARVDGGQDAGLEFNFVTYRRAK